MIVFIFFVIREYPLECLHVLPYDIGRTVVSDEFEIPVIRCQPTVHDLHDFDGVGLELDASGCLVRLVPRIAVNVYLHTVLYSVTLRGLLETH